MLKQGERLVSLTFDEERRPCMEIEDPVGSITKAEKEEV